MKCFECGLDSPYSDARFCVSCGKPLAQLSPYLPLSEAKLIPLRDEKGHQPRRCLYTDKPLKTCPACGRLRTLQPKSCKCGNLLVESGNPFPSSAGSLDGTRVVRWPRDWSDSPVGQLSIPPPPAMNLLEIRDLTYRYGWVMALSERSLMLLDPHPDDPHRLNTNSTLSFQGTPGPALDMLVDNGRAFVRCKGASVVFELPDDQEILIPGESIRQAKSDAWWVRIVKINPQQCDIKIHRCDRALQQRPDYTISWSIKAEEVHDLVVRESVNNQPEIFVAAKAGLFRWTPELSQLENAPIPPADWTRVAATPAGIVATGYDSQRIPQIMVWEPGGQQQGPFPMDRDCLADFAVSGETVLVPCRQGYVLYQLQQLSQTGEVIRMLNSQDTEEGPLLLQDSRDQVRALLVRKDRFGKFLYLTIRGFDVQIGGTQGLHRPLLCVADGRILVCGKRGSGSELQVFNLP